MLLYFFLFHILSDKPYYSESILFQPKNWNATYYRIPAIATLNDGKLITFTDARYLNKNDLPSRISIMQRISPDNGKSWSDPVIISGETRDYGDGDAAIVVDRKTGTVFALWNGGSKNGFASSTADDPLRLYFSRSYDNGNTWEKSHDITDQIYGAKCTTCPDDQYKRSQWQGCFITSGAALQARDGRIMAALVVRRPGSPGYNNFVIFSDDFGETWNVSLKASDGADEAKLAQKNNGEIIISVRQTGNRKFSFSPDNGYDWRNGRQMPDIYDSPCNGEIMRYTSTIDGYNKNRLLHTVTYHKGFPRQNVSILISYDEGETWPVKKPIYSNLGSYSSIAIGHDGLIHVYYEKGDDDNDPDVFNMTVVTFNLEWITDGEDHYEKASNLNWCISDEEKAPSNCPSNSYKATSKIFDQYIDSYWEYPTNVNYTFTQKVRDFSINISTPGMQNGKYYNLYSSAQPKITIIGRSKEKISFTFYNFEVHADIQNLIDNDFTFIGCNVQISGQSSGIRVGESKIVVMKNIGTRQQSKIINIEQSTNIEILNSNSGSSKFYLYKGILGVEEKISINVKITAATKDTNIVFPDSWSTDEGSLITISTTSQNGKTKIYTQKVNIDKFKIDGDQPEFIEK